MDLVVTVIWRRGSFFHYFTVRILCRFLCRVWAKRLHFMGFHFLLTPLPDLWFTHLSPSCHSLAISALTLPFMPIPSYVILSQFQRAAYAYGLMKNMEHNFPRWAPTFVWIQLTILWAQLLLSSSNNITHKRQSPLLPPGIFCLLWHYEWYITVARVKKQTKDLKKQWDAADVSFCFFGVFLSCGKQHFLPSTASWSLAALPGNYGQCWSRFAHAFGG